jgi:hypothetical protein
MKTTIQKAAAQFKPVNITITFETQTELDAFGSAMNTVCIGSAIEEAAGLEIDSLLGALVYPLEKLGADVRQADKITSLVKKRLPKF